MPLLIFNLAMHVAKQLVPISSPIKSSPHQYFAITLSSKFTPPEFCTTGIKIQYEYNYVRIYGDSIMKI